MPVQVVAKDVTTGTEYVSRDVNFNGSAFGIVADREFGTIDDPVYIGTFRNRNSVLWGCPAWNRTSASMWNGYAMNYYPLAPQDDKVPSVFSEAFYSKRALRNSTADTNPTSTSARQGKYYKQAQYTRPGERALLYEDTVAVLQLNSGAFRAWIWTPEATTRAWPLRPSLDTTELSIDFNRHGKREVGNKPNDPSLNILYCDGHAETASARQVYRAIRFH